MDTENRSSDHDRPEGEPVNRDEIGLGLLVHDVLNRHLDAIESTWCEADEPDLLLVTITVEGLGQDDPLVDVETHDLTAEPEPTGDDLGADSFTLVIGCPMAQPAYGALRAELMANLHEHAEILRGADGG